MNLESCHSEPSIVNQDQLTELPRLCYTSNRFLPKTRKNERSSDDIDSDEQLYEVRIIDNDFNTYRQVMDVTMVALGIDEEQAFAVAWEVDHRGYCVVARSPLYEANSIARIIRSIGIEVQVNPIDDGGFDH